MIRISQFFLKTEILKQKFRPRYFFVPFLILVGILITPSILQVNPNWVPIGSIENQGAWGYSDAFDTITDYQIEISTTPLAERTDLNNRNTLLIINSPERDITTTERDYLQNRMNSGYPTLFIGPQTSGQSRLITLLSNTFSIGDQVYDFENNGGYAAAPEVISTDFSNNPGMKFTAVAPLQISNTRIFSDFDEFQFLENSLVNSMSTSKTSTCIVEQKNELELGFIVTDCRQSVSIASKNQETVVLGDTWMLRNNFTDAFPNNLNLLNLLISNFSHPIERIVVDETHLDWAPVNFVGLSILGYQLLTSNFYLVVFLILGVLLPLGIGLYSGGFSFQNFVDQQRLTQRIKQRLEAIHISKVPAVPLSLEEKILVNEYHQLEIHGPAYLSKVARDYLEYVQENKIETPAFLTDKLKYLSLNVLNESTSWRIIEDFNFYLESLHSPEFK